MNTHNGPKTLCNFLSCVVFVVATAVLLPLAKGQTQKPTFVPILTVETGLEAVAAGDFNGDGLPDAISGPVEDYNNGSLPLTVTLNQGPDVPPTTVVTTVQNCGQLGAIVAGDLNNDKKLDVVLSCSDAYEPNSTTLVLMFGNGDGTFQTPSYYPLPYGSYLMTPVDLNGDGYLDVVAALNGYTTTNIAVLLNKGSSAPGVLGNASSYPTGFGYAITEMESGDFNGDGRQDICAGAIVPSGGFQIAVFYGNGDGRLQAAKSVKSAVPFAAADFNHDGITDLASLGYTNSTSVQVLLGNTGGTFTAGSTLNLPASYIIPTYDTQGTAVASTWVDSATGNTNLALLNGSMAILRGDGKGGLSIGESYPYQVSNVFPVTGSDGKAALVLFDGERFLFLAPNNNGTFQGPVAFPFSEQNDAGFASADLNNDGLTDVIAFDGVSNIITSLGRGDGTFSMAGQVPVAGISQILIPGDFNDDGKIDVEAVLQGLELNDASGNAELSFYKGNGNGSLQPGTTAVALQYPLVTNAVAGDFNGDGKLDLVLTYVVDQSSGYKNILMDFLAGNGDGTFASPVQIYESSSLYEGGTLLVGDLNGDKTPDLIWNNIAFLGKGNGTFSQIALNASSPAIYPLAAGDLNGDGIPDLVVGLSVYAGNGDGTFQTNPFLTVTAPKGFESLYEYAILIGDLNADGHPDLLVQYSEGPSGEPANIAVYLGDGKGNLVADGFTYTAGNSYQGYPSTAFARLNYLAPAAVNDHAPDLLTFTNSGAVALLNQHNPTPEIRMGTTTALVASASTVNVGESLTFTATVTGADPTGSVSFVAETSTLGTTSVTDGVATLMTSFSTAGTHSVAASYSGDIGNTASTSAALPITVLGPDFTLTALPVSATVAAGQSTSATLTITPSGGYAGTVSFSCGGLPEGAACTFSPASVSPSGNAAATTTLTVTTTAHSSALLQNNKIPDSRPVQTIAWVGAFLLLFSPKRISRFNRRLLGLWLLVPVTASLMGGCSGSSSAGSGNSGTPKGTQTITVTAADAHNSLSHTVNFQITVQ
jgi:hypothetical protein